MTARTPVRRAGIGFGLIALLMVIVIIGIIYTVQTNSGKSYPQQIADTRKQSVELGRQISTQQLSLLIAQYREENRKLPTTAEDMDAVATFRDEWGNPITFAFTDEGGVTRVTFTSSGPDGEPKTADDMVRRDTLPF